MTETTPALHPPPLAGIREIAFAYGVRDMTADEQGQIIAAIFELCDLIEHLHLFASQLIEINQGYVDIFGGTT